MRGGDTPGAVGATPAGEVIPLDPDQAFVHTSLPFACVWDSSSGAAGGTTSIERARKVNSCPSPRVISHRVCERPSNQGASPASDRSRRVGVRVPGPAWPTAQFSTVKGGMSREVGHGFCVGFEGKRRAGARLCGALVVRKRCVRLRFGAVSAGVLLEAFLSNPVKCKRRVGDLEARGDEARTAVRTAPACESFILSPNHASRHECTS